MFWRRKNKTMQNLLIYDQVCCQKMILREVKLDFSLSVMTPSLDIAVISLNFGKKAAAL